MAGYGNIEYDTTNKRRGGRVVEGAPLLRAYRAKLYRGFESLSLRQKEEAFCVCPHCNHATIFELSE